jgi:hypothetical protein
MTERQTPGLGPDAVQGREPRTATTAEEAMRQEAWESNAGVDSDLETATLQDTADEQAYAPEER